MSCLIWQQLRGSGNAQHASVFLHNRTSDEKTCLRNVTFLWFTARCASFLKDIQINNNTQSQQFLKYWKYLATVTFSFVLLDTSFYIKWLFFCWFEFMDTKIPTYVILAWAWFLSHCSYFYSFYFCGIWLGRHKDYLVWVRVSNNNNNNSVSPYNPNQQEQH